MNKRGNAFSFIAGVCAGIANVLCALNALTSVFSAIAYDAADLGLLLASGALLAVAATNLMGGCICRNHRVAGGVMMLASALVLLAFGASCLYFSLAQPEVFSGMFDAEYAVGVRRAVLGAGMLLALANLLSAAAGAVSLSIRSVPETD